MGCSVSNLTIDLVDDCKPNGQGLYEKMFSVRLSDIVSVSFDATHDTLATGVTLKSGTKLRIWEGRKLSHNRTVGFSANDYGNKVPHGLRFAVFTNSPAAKKEINGVKDMTDLVVFSKQSGANGDWEMAGYPTGLACTGVERDSNNADMPGVPILTFSADQATKMPLTFKHITSSVDDTEVYLTALAT